MPLIIAERFRFQKRNQHEGESVSDYVVALKQLATHCEFGPHLNEALRDRFVSGLRVEATQRKLLAETNVTFKSACDTTLAMEMASRNTLEFSGTINKVYNPRRKKEEWKKQGDQNQNRNAPQQTSVDGKHQQARQPSYRCGGKHVASVCKFKQEKCHHCSKVGHITYV